MNGFFKTIIIVNAAIAVPFGFFYALVKVCDYAGLSPWLIVLFYFGVPFVMLCMEAKGAPHVED